MCEQTYFWISRFEHAMNQMDEKVKFLLLRMSQIHNYRIREINLKNMKLKLKDYL